MNIRKNALLPDDTGAKKHGGKRTGAGRPVTVSPQMKRVPLPAKVPQWLLDKVDKQPQSRRQVVETALIKHLGEQDDDTIPKS